MSTRIFTFYNLRPGVNLKEFKEWSRTVDQPICNSMPTCNSFEVFLVNQGIGDGVSYNVVEDISVESWDAWQETLSSDAFSKVSTEWPRFAVESSLISISCEKIE
ncbi:hypothetical protein [Cryobacterium sp. M91]|uniref:hypothetical protein n=1 Tax=Cryobacterium sp. M91 TaxID=2048294 RepID=UPI000CE2CF51|nr:hypothetical protein [Cryobacterium sp. M91]